MDTIPVDIYPQGVEVNPITGRVYIANTYSATVSVIDGVTNAVVATIPLPISSFPMGVGVNPATGRVYVADYGHDTRNMRRRASSSGNVSTGCRPATTRL